MTDEEPVGHVQSQVSESYKAAREGPVFGGRNVTCVLCLCSDSCPPKSWRQGPFLGR